MSILKLKDSQGNWIGVPTIKGDKGNGISSAVLNNDYTLTLTFTDGTTYTTPSIRGEKGEQGEPATDMNIHICSSNEYDSETRIPTITSPDDKTFYLVPTVDGTSPDLFTEWIYVNNAWEMFGSASIDLSGYLTDVAVNGNSVVTDGVAEIPVANSTNLGVAKFNGDSYGIGITSSGDVYGKPPSDAQVQTGTNIYKPITPSKQHISAFYGLAKASGHDEKDSTLPVGQYTDEAKASIQSMLGVPSEDEVVTDVQVNGTSVVTDGVAEIPIAKTNSLGLVKMGQGVQVDAGGNLYTTFATPERIKAENTYYNPITPVYQHNAVFYGLAHASGDTTQKTSNNEIGQYTDEAKSSIQDMLDVPSNADLDEVEEKVDQNTEDLLKAFPIESASGNIASFEDGANDIPLQSLVVDINPVQDLHGYDSPWVAGGGINKFDVQSWATLGTNPNYYSVSSNGEITVNTTDGGGIGNRLMTFIPSTRYKIVQSGFRYVNVYTSSASTLSSTDFTVPEDGKIAIKPIPQEYPSTGWVMIVPYESTATSWTPYENICPISGWTGMQLTQANENLIPESVPDNVISGTPSNSKILSASTAKIFAIPIPKNTPLHIQKISGDTSGGTTGLLEDGEPQVGDAWINGKGFTNVINQDYTANEYSWMGIGSSTLEGAEAYFTTRELMVSMGNTRKDYVAPKGYSTRHISWQTEAGTVYGGRLDVLSGVLTVDRAMVDMGSLSWSYQSGFGRMKANIPDIEYATSNNLPSGNLMCSIYVDGPAALAYHVPKSVCVGINSTVGVLVYDDTYTDATSFTMAVTGQTLCYKLATPIEIQLDAHTINSLYGANNIWADTGDTACEYRADPDLYIQRKMPDVPVDDVQINGQSIVTDGVANIVPASTSDIKSGSSVSKFVPTGRQETSVFYGLAKAASDTTQSQSSNAVGNYTDNAKDKIQTMLGVSPLIAPHESDPFESAHVIGELFIINGKLYRAKTALTAGEYVNEGTNVEVVDVAEVLDGKVGDVQIDGNSIVSDGVAEIPNVTIFQTGLASVNTSYGIGAAANGSGILMIQAADLNLIKTATGYGAYKPIVPTHQHESVFYGLTKAAGVNMSTSSNPVGTYTDEAKTAIKTMLGVHDTYDSFIEEVTGTDVTITGQPSYRYNCGELYSLTVTPPSSGTIDIRFTSGSTPTVLTLPSTVKMPEWWVEVEANTIYEMCITDGVYCGVMSWAM